MARYATSYQGILVDPYAPFVFSDGIALTNPGGLYTAINNHGDIAYGVRGVGFDASGNFVGLRSGIFTLDGPVVRTGDTTPLGGSYSNSSLQSSRFHLNDQGQVLSNARLGLTIFGGNDAVISFAPQVDGSYFQTLHAAWGQPIAKGYVASGTVGWGSYNLSNQGSVATGVVAIGAAGVPEALHVIDGDVVRTSSQLPHFGGSQFNLFNNSIAINDNGDHGYHGSLFNDDWETFRWAVFRNDFELVWIDDGQVEHLEGRNFSNLGSFNMTNSGDLYWTASFDDPLGLTHRGLFRNDELIVSSDQSIKGVTYFPSFTYDISDDGTWLIIESWDSGIYRAYIPSPATTTLLALIALSTTQRRRKPA